MKNNFYLDAVPKIENKLIHIINQVFLGLLIFSVCAISFLYFTSNKYDEYVDANKAYNEALVTYESEYNIAFDNRFDYYDIDYNLTVTSAELLLVDWIALVEKIDPITVSQEVTSINGSMKTFEAKQTTRTAKATYTFENHQSYVDYTNFLENQYRKTEYWLRSFTYSNYQNNDGVITVTLDFVINFDFFTVGYEV